MYSIQPSENLICTQKPKARNKFKSYVYEDKIEGWYDFIYWNVCEAVSQNTNKHKK